MKSNDPDILGYLLISALLVFLSYAGYLSYKSIDWTVLKRLESQTLVIPTPIIASPSAIQTIPQISTTSSTSKN